MKHQPQPQQSDEDLKVLLRAVDPAADLPAIDPAWTSWKARQIMDTTQQATSAVRGPRRARRQRAGIFAGAGLGTAAAGIIAAITIGTSGAAVSALTLPPTTSGGPSAMCAQVTPDALAQRETAFEARAVSIGDGRVTFEVTHRYKGEVEDQVSIPQPEPDLPLEFSPGQFSLGADYLISTSTGGQVTACGQSGPTSPQLRELYQQAYTS